MTTDLPGAYLGALSGPIEVLLGVTVVALAAALVLTTRRLWSALEAERAAREREREAAAVEIRRVQEERLKDIKDVASLVTPALQSTRETLATLRETVERAMERRGAR